MKTHKINYTSRPDVKVVTGDTVGEMAWTNKARRAWGGQRGNVTAAEIKTSTRKWAAREVKGEAQRVWDGSGGASVPLRSRVGAMTEEAREAGSTSYL